MTGDDTRGRCAGCGLGPHRYSTADPHHKYDPMACVNMLRAERDEAVRLLRQNHADLLRALDVHGGGHLCATCAFLAEQEPA